MVDLSEDADEEEELFQTGNSRVVDALTAYAGWPSAPPSSSSTTTTTVTTEQRDDDEGEDPTFETLFSQLAQFRDSANALPTQQRREMAEDLALKFYAAIGGGDSSEDETPDT